MLATSPFFEHWRQCLAIQYQDASRTGDNDTGLAVVLQEAGFSATEIEQLRLWATMHVDDLSESQIEAIAADPLLSQGFMTSVASADPCNVPVAPEWEQHSLL